MATSVYRHTLIVDLFLGQHCHITHEDSSSVVPLKDSSIYLLSYIHHDYICWICIGSLLSISSSRRLLVYCRVIASAILYLEAG
jgi:hypothetical protein